MLEILFWLLVIGLTLVAAGPTVIRLAPSDPPYVTLLFTLFGRTNRVIGGIGGLRLRVPWIFDFILVNIGKRNLDIKEFSIVTKDNVFVEVPASITWLPDWLPEHEAPQGYQHRLGRFLTASASAGAPPSWKAEDLQKREQERNKAINTILEDLVKQHAKDWITRHAYEVVKRDGSTVLTEQIVPLLIGEGNDMDPDLGTPDILGLGIRISNFTIEDIDLDPEVARRLVEPRLARAEREADFITAEAKAGQIIRYLRRKGYSDDEIRTLSLREWNEIMDRFLAEKGQPGINIIRASADEGLIQAILSALA
jgi:regulator of protease activity HflC (stomatin/prohibitin superfamily)